MEVKLIIVGGKIAAKEIVVKRPMILGRAKGIGIVIPHPLVSERHCLLFDHAGLLMIQDLNSAHGTLVGGRKAITVPLPPGTEFTVGPLTFRVEYVYTGNLQALPKPRFDESEPAAVAPSAEVAETPAIIKETPAVVKETLSTPAHTPPSAPSDASPTFFSWGTAENETSAEATAALEEPAPEFPSFFGFGDVEAAGGSSTEAPRVDFPVIEPKESHPKATQAAPVVVKEVKEASRIAIPEAPDEPAEEIDETESGIPDFVVRPKVSVPPPTKPEQPVKQKGGVSLFGLFGKKLPQGKKPTPPPPQATPPTVDASPNKAVSFFAAEEVDSEETTSAKEKAWSEEPPDVAALTHPQPKPPPVIEKKPAESCDDDLSNFFKKLQ